MPRKYISIPVLLCGFIKLCAFDPRLAICVMSLDSPGATISWDDGGVPSLTEVDVCNDALSTEAVFGTLATAIDEPATDLYSGD